MNFLIFIAALSASILAFELAPACKLHFQVLAGRIAWMGFNNGNIHTNRPSSFAHSLP